MLSFRVCNNDVGLDDVICPHDRAHGHIWDGKKDLPISLFPILTSKTIALKILFELSDLVLKDGALGSSPSISRVQEEIRRCGLPEEDT